MLFVGTNRSLVMRPEICGALASTLCKFVGGGGIGIGGRRSSESGKDKASFPEPAIEMLTYL